jgi:SAM-dependent methyltransferase
MPEGDVLREGGRLYDGGAAGYDARLRAQPASLTRLLVIERRLRELARRSARVLDLGCGTGRLAGGLQTAPLAGVDLSLGMLREAVRKGLPVACADAHAVPFADATFDLVIAANAVFRHLRLDDALGECARVLRPGGRLGLHHHAARFWSPRRPFTRPALRNAQDLESIEALEQAAARQGLTLVDVRLWRCLRFWPYLLRVPSALAWHLWDHGLFVLEKTAR